MRLRVLGPLALEAGGPGAGGGGDVPVTSPKLRRLLAVLAVSAGAVVPVDRIADAMWGEDPPRNVEGALHSLVSRLRGVLRAAGAEGDAGLLTRPPGYLLDVGPDGLDAARFARLAARGATLVDPRPDQAVEVLDEALGLWRGPAYAEFADDDFARAEAVRLSELRATAAEDLVDATLRLGRADEAVARLEPLVAEQPLRERPHALLVLALYRSARQADALAVYRRYRDRLDAELGIEPSPALARMESQVLRQDPELDWTAPAAIPAAALAVEPPPDAPTPEAPTPEAPTPEAPATKTVAETSVSEASVPAARGSEPSPAELAPPEPSVSSPSRVGRSGAVPPRREIVGRDQLLATVAERLQDVALLTLVGPGGVGKTTLAMSAAAVLLETGAFPDGVWTIELARVSSGDAVVDAVTSALDVVQRAGTNVRDRLVEDLRPRRALLVLDNCEHVVDACADLVDAIVRDCPHVAVLATSREPLHLLDEHVLSVPALALPDPGTALADLLTVPSVALFAARAAASSGFSITAENAEAVAELCRRLDGLPLAIELAASRMRALGPGDVVARLGSRFRILRSANRVAEERHRTLRAVVDWSHGLLDEHERTLFARLSVFAGTFDLRAATAVGSAGHDSHDMHDEADIADVVADLVDKSMVTVVDDAGSTRYTLLETLRAYAAERLAERGETEQVQRAHAVHHVEEAEETVKGIRGPDVVACLDRLSARFDDLRAAHGWALEHDLELAVRLVAALFDYAELRMPPEVPAWAERTVEAVRARGSSTPLVAVVYAVAAGGARFRGDLDLADALAEEGLDAVPDLSDPLRRYARFIQMEVALFKGEADRAADAGAELEVLAAAADDPLHGVLGAMDQTLVAAYAGDVARAIAQADALGARADTGRSPIATAWVRYAQGEVRLDAEPELAATLLEEALARAREIDDRYLRGVALVSLASLRVRHGDPVLALPLFGEVVAYWQQAGTWPQQWTTLRNVVDLLVRVGLDEPAARLLGGLTQRPSSSPVFGADAERLAIARRVLAARLGDERFAAAVSAGAALSDDEVVAAARVVLDDAVRTTTAEPNAPRPAARPLDPDLVGRDADLAALRRDLATHRLVTLIGAGGVGKTRLVHALVEDLRASGEPVALLELAAAHDAGSVSGALASLFDVRAPAGQTAVEAVGAVVSARQLVLVVDTCEHVLEVVRTLVGDLLEAAPQLRVVATSRAPLGTRGEHLRRLGALPVPPLEASPSQVARSAAVRLFRDRARAVGVEVADVDLPLVADLCRRVDGLPLAIELAAGRLRTLGLRDLWDRLDDDLGLLEGPRGDVQHATLRAVVDWSRSLLDPSAAALFAEIAVFDGGFTMAAAEHVAGQPETVATALSALVDSSLVSAEPSDEEGRLRYRMLDTVRAVARDHLRASGQQAGVSARHTAWVGALVEQAGAGLAGPDEARWVRRLAAEMGNVRGAWTHAMAAGDVDAAARIVIALRSFVAWRWAGSSELYEWAHALVRQPALSGSPHESSVLGVAAEAAFARGDLDATERLARRGLTRRASSPAGVPRCAYALGLVALLRGDAAATERWWTDAAQDPHTPPVEAASHRGNVALARLTAGDLEGARAALIPFAAFARDGGWPTARAWAAYLDGLITAVTDADAAVAPLQEALTLAGAMGSSFVEGLAATALAATHRRRGDLAAAAAAYPQVLRHWQRAGNAPQLWTAIEQVGVLLARLGADDDAAVLLAAAAASPATPPPQPPDAEGVAAVRDAVGQRLGSEAMVAAQRQGAGLEAGPTVELAIAALGAPVSV